MKRRFTKIVLLAACIGLLTAMRVSAQEKVTLYPYMVVNESGEGDAGLMVDEQDFAGDPLSGNANEPSTKWSTGYDVSYPLSAYIDFGQSLDLTHVFIFDYNNVSDLVVESGEPGNWTLLFVEPLNSYKSWKQHVVNVNTRYLRFSKSSAGANFSEVVVYAENATPLPPAISDLHATDSLPQAVTLSWTCIEGNGATGALTGYKIRYSNDSITEENFDAAQSFANTLAPEPGSEQEITVTGLSANTPYYFAVKVAGELGDSYISNVIRAQTPYFYNQVEAKLLLLPSMVTNESGLGDATKMVDEQDLAGDPLGSTGGEPVTYWNPDNDPENYPLSAYIEFGAEVLLSRVLLFDSYSSGDLIVEYGSPGDWHYLFTEPLDSYRSWKAHDVNVFTSHLRLTKTTSSAKFTEVVVYGLQPQVQEEKIPLDISMIDNVSGYGEATNLVDEQDIAGDLLNSPGGNPLTYWETGTMSSIIYPLHCILDMRKEYELTKVFIRDRNNSDEFRIYAGYPENWNLIVTDNLTGYLSWNQHDVDADTRYLKIEKSSAAANVSEIVLYGYDKTPGMIDTVPPAQIEDLFVMPTQTDEVIMKWTAPGDDGTMGRADFYIMRYDSKPITAENFARAVKVSDVPAPGAAGETQVVTLGNLTPDTKYYFAVQAVDDALNYGPVSNIASCKTNIQIGGESYKFTLTNDMLLNESTHGDAALLIDEQSQSGDPREGDGGVPATRWDMGNTAWKYPGYLLIDLQGQCEISDIYIYDAADAGEDSTSAVRLYWGEPFNWIPLLTDPLQNEDTWNAHPVEARTRFLRVELLSPETRLNELIVYGTRMEEPVQVLPPQSYYHDPVPVDQMIGVNAFVNGPIGRMKAAGFVREYHNWMWCEGNNNSSYPGYPDNQNDFNTLGWNFDYYYQNLKDLGITASPDIQDNVPWLTGWDYSRLSDKPLINDSADALDPASYVAHSDHLFQYAARYGNQVVPDSLLKLDADEYRISGTGLLNYYESWNEPDKWWRGRDAFFTPYEYAAMASADYDGNRGAMGPTVGVKNADPDARLVMGGLADPDIDYIRAIKLWADYHRNGDVPVDVINVHHYSNDGTSQTSGSVGISPEDDNLRGLMQTFVDYRNNFLPEKEVWITEFGYDINAGSVQRAPVIGTFSAQEVQAQWLVRSYLALAAAGVDRAVMYMLKDVDENSSGKFSSSGMIRNEAHGYAPKISWYYVYTMKNRLKDMVFDTEIPTGNPNVMVYRFKHTSQGAATYVVWCPTSNQTTVQDFALTLAGDENTAKLVQLAEGSIVGSESPLVINNHQVHINVSERPVFVMAFSEEVRLEMDYGDELLTIAPSMVVNESGFGDAGLLADEQQISGNPLMGTGGDAITKWDPEYNATYPCHAYIDLGRLYDISMIYVRDMNSSGDVEFSVGAPGKWTPVCSDDLKRYKVWSGHVIDQTSRYLRVTLNSSSSNISEILFYVRDN